MLKRHHDSSTIVLTREVERTEFEVLRFGWGLLRPEVEGSFGKTSEPNPTQLVSFSIQVRKPSASELSFHDVKSMGGQTGQPLIGSCKDISLDILRVPWWRWWRRPPGLAY